MRVERNGSWIASLMLGPRRKPERKFPHALVSGEQRKRNLRSLREPEKLTRVRNGKEG
jgi:hypothetical protein